MSDPAVANQNSVMQRLRMETRPAHDRIEAVPFSEAILEERLPQSLFAGQLTCWLRVHQTLEGALSASEDDAVQAVWKEEMARTSCLEGDLLHHGEPAVSSEAEAATDRTTQWLESLAQTEPRSLLGCLYVLEGSKMGGAILRKHLQAAYGCESTHLSYFWSSGVSPMPDFKAFKERMESALPDKRDQDQVVAAASGMFDHLTDVLMGLEAGA
ncbi:MAG: biliverdin-producing heme oxygenase [Phycisphaerales bacterium]|nr:biliverdin-producing heme oxygenase [Phycisphaerales bacterium]